MNRLLWAYAAYPHKNNSIRNVVCNVLVRYKKPQYYAERINKIVSKYGRHNTKYCRNILGIPRPLNLLCDREWYAMVEQRKFEEYQFPIPKGYDEILTMLYGNYMELPPEDERVSMHTFRAFKKESFEN